MARTKAIPRRCRPRENELSQMEQFEKQMRKYYPKSSRFFYNGSHYQPRCADNFKNPNSLVPRGYKRDFFRSFYADSETFAPEPSKIPHNLQVLKVFVGSEIVLRKIIKQNKGLKHIVLDAYDDNEELNATIVKYLKYSKILRSIKFQRMLPYFSEKQCKKMRRTWGKTLESFECHGKISRKFKSGHKSFTRAMETILMFPNLKMFQFNGAESHVDLGESFPFEKLQARNIAYNVKFKISDFNSSIEKFPESRPAGNVVIPLDLSDGKSNKMSLEMWKFQKKSNQTLSLEFRYDNEDFKRNLLPPVFQNISSLDLTIPGYRSDFKCSSMGQLNNLMHLSVEIADRIEIVGDFFSFLNNNVAPHQKLETFLIKTDFEMEKNKQNNDAIVNFFEVCSQSLKTVNFEFIFYDERYEDTEPFYKGLSKLERVQSFSHSLYFSSLESNEQVNKLCKVLSEMNSLKELDLEIFGRDPKEEQLDLKFPPQLKKLSVRMDTSLPSFNTLETLGPLTNLTHLELEFSDFSSPKWRKILSDLIDKIKRLEVLVLKGIKKDEDENGVSSQMKERLDVLMKESLNLKLIVFANMQSKKIIILKRNYSWSEINPIIADLSVEEDMEVDYIKSYT